MRSLLLLGAILLGSAASRAALAHVDPWPSKSRQVIEVGTLALRPCADAPAYCGSIERAFDPKGSIAGHTSIHFEYYPHTSSGEAIGVLVATEGGPGYPATGSRDEYLALFKPLLRQRDLIIMDNRGTGQSGAVDCHELQTAEKWTIELTAACGDSLGARAPLYSTAYAADDLAAILEALHVRQVDLYGDSYGTYFAQVFVLRHSDLLRSVVLDGAYPLNGEDYPWYPTYAPAMRYKFDTACRRYAPCAALPGTSIEHIQPLLETLRSAPFRASAADSDGRLRTFTAEPAQLATVMFGGSPALATVRELDAAARAFVLGDRLPALRLVAETISGVDSRDPTGDAAKYSAGLAAAVMCQDPPQIFDMRLPVPLRLADRNRAIAERQRSKPDTYAPFLIDEYRGMPLDYSFIDQCVQWPAAPIDHPASHVAATDAQYPDIPALVLSGEFDNITTMADGAAVAASFKHGRQIRIQNSFHVNALPHARSACGAQLVRRFIETLSPGDTACAASVAPLRLVPAFVRHASELLPATATKGNIATAADLRLASAAAATVGDALVRVWGNSSGQGVGLRGGNFRNDAAATGSRVTLSNVRWTEDLAVSGTIVVSGLRNALVRAQVHLIGPETTQGDLSISWREGKQGAAARLRGTIDGRLLIARTPAP